MLIWFSLGVALILLELITPTFILMFFGFGALGAALTAHVYPGLVQEFIVFILVTSLSLFLFRQKMKHVFQGFRAGQQKNPVTQNFIYIGKQAKVQKSISPQSEGEVFVGGSYWRATANVSIPKDAIVIIEAQDADDKLLLIVKPQ